MITGAAGNISGAAITTTLSKRGFGAIASGTAGAVFNSGVSNLHYWSPPSEETVVTSALLGGTATKLISSGPGGKIGFAQATFANALAFGFGSVFAVKRSSQ